MQKDNIQRPSKGLHTDNSPQDQPKDTYRFALNTVNETELGDSGFVGNEESNEICAPLTEGFVPIGKVYIGNDELAIFSVHPDGISEIGVLNTEVCKYTAHVNDELSDDAMKLNFKIEHQIKATYRLRRGCERTVYFVDGPNNKPRIYNFNKPENFQTAGNWDANKFELRRSYQSVPVFDNVEVLNSGGQLEPGSYNVAIQYLDEDLNPTEWIATTPIIYVYNDDTDEEFLNIRGSINSDTDYLDFSITDKAIRVDLSNLDTSFLFYRLAFIEATSGLGVVNNVRYTDTIPTSKNYFIYTGVNFATTGTEEEIQAFTNVIDSADSIEQIENRLILANIRGKQVNYCKLQKFASRIKADMILKPIIVNQLIDGSPKHPTVNFDSVGYMPGETYSFGIVYVFKDGSLSPVYHIPGKNPDLSNDMVFEPQVDGEGNPTTFGMIADNESENNIYVDNSNCGIEDYWGTDSEGDTLTGEFVRHHKFPLRSDLGLDLVEEIESIEASNEFYQIVFSGSGTIYVCTEEEYDAGDCDPIAEPFQARVEYTVDGVPGSMTVNIDPNNESNPFSFEEKSEFFTSSSIVITGIYESTDPVTDITGVTSPKGIDYVASVEMAEFSTEQRLYKTNIFGIQFSGVDLPTVDDTNGEEIIGYYIVRNDRTESEKTILDSAAMIPCVTNNKYISHGLLGPQLDDTDRLSKKVFGFINPEYKFNNIKYNEFTDIIQEGQFNIVDRKFSKSRYRDVLDGTSFDSDVHKGGGGNDNDGWSIKAITRDNIVDFKKVYSFNKTGAEIKDTYYLAALESRDINDDTNTVYNIAGDNRVGILELEDDYNTDLRNKIPYLYFRRDIADSYSTFRTLPYYKTTTNMSTTDVVSVFGGDTFVTPMRYTNTVFWDNRIAERAGKTSVWNYIIGGILVVVGAVLAFFTAGATTLVVAAGIAIIGGGALFIASGVKRDALVNAYQDEYEKGLRETALDNWTEEEYQRLPCTRDTANTDFYTEPHGHCDTPEDDEIEWIGDCITDLWFESQVNTLIRNGFAVSTPTFLNAPGKIESGNEDIEQYYEHFGIYKQKDILLAPATELDKHIMKKLTTFDASRGDSRTYIGHPLGEYYQVNPDYDRLNSQKVFFHLGLEYDCCSDCQEEFPQRVHYSEQSFQEELTDNYRVFLPNNYRDIEGEKGVITNLYRLQNNLYIHTEEALWHLPQNYQERVTNDIVSFIGTGSYFEIPPRLIVDADESSAGTKHGHGTIKTKNGILFPSQIEGKWHLFNGNQLKAISDYGMSNWFKNNMSSIVAQQYFNSNGRPYPFLNNPSNPYGEGFISTYDTKKERYIVTKKDFYLNQNLVDLQDYEICIQDDNSVIVFEDFEQTIADQAALGYEYVGIEDCQMKFQKTEYNEVEEERTITSRVSNTADIHIFYDTSGSFDSSIIGSRPIEETDDLGPTLTSIDEAVDDWITNFGAANPDWTGNVYKYIDSTERWLAYPSLIESTTYSGEDLSTKDVIIISFCNEANNVYHGSTLDNVIEAPTTDFNDDYADFLTLHAQYKSFLGIHYPVVFDSLDTTKEFLVHSLAALKGVSYTSAETSTLNPNPGMTSGEWNDLVAALEGTNPYPDDGLENYGWYMKEDRYKDGDGNVIDSDTFQEDITDLLIGATTTEVVNVTILEPYIDNVFIAGVPLIGDLIQYDNSWTMSYSLKNNMWISWHSYIPNMYMYVPEKFFSFKYGNDNIWKHGRIGHYQTYYGDFNPHILEYVSLSNPLSTRIWNHLRLITEAKKYHSSTNEYYDERFITFHKGILYNSRQCSGELIFNVKNNNDADYLLDQIQNIPSVQNIDRNERDWTVNDLRDIRINYSVPIWNSTLSARQSDYYIDKVLNTSSMSFSKDWTELESFRDKYLVIRLIFDNFVDVKLLTNYTVENEQQSFR